MKVRELIEQLQQEDPDALVVMSRDSEGNSYSPLSDFWTGVYQADTTWSGEVGFGELTQELQEHGYNEEDILSDGVPAVILSPIC